MTKTEKTLKKKLEALASTSLALLAPSRLMIDDKRWGAMFGFVIDLPGGCELEVDNGTLAWTKTAKMPSPDVLTIRFIVRDPYLPPLGVLVPFLDIANGFNEIEPLSGPRNLAGRKRCTHQEAEPPVPHCEYCLWRWWSGKAEAAE